MSAVDVAALTASIIAGTLAVVAIGLSIAFYRMSMGIADGINQAEQKISASVDRLEKLFDTLYRDALGLLKEMYGDVRARNSVPRQGPSEFAAPASPAGEPDQRLAVVKRQVQEGMSALLARASAEHRDPGTVSTEMTEIIDRAIAQSRLSNPPKGE